MRTHESAKDRGNDIMGKRRTGRTINQQNLDQHASKARTESEPMDSRTGSLVSAPVVRV